MQLVDAIVRRRRRVVYPRWFLWLRPIRQFFGSAWLEFFASRRVVGPMQEFDRLIAERGVERSTASARTVRSRAWGAGSGPQTRANGSGTDSAT